MISQTAEYALRAVVYLGNQQGASRTTSQISEAVAAPSNYLSKVMQGLCRAGIVDSQRGLHGGFTLIRDAAELTMLEIINAVDALRRIDRCPLGREAHGSNLCPLHRRLDGAMAAAEESFRTTTVDALLDTAGSSSVCHFPCTTDPVWTLEDQPT